MVVSILSTSHSFIATKSKYTYLLYTISTSLLLIGEEEAIFSWAATNFIMGTLLPQSEGLGLVTYNNHTYGTLDLGGASTQIAYYVPSQDIMEGLYKFQLGGQKQWNVYTKSFLQFGVDSARQRHLMYLIDQYNNNYIEHNQNDNNNKSNDDDDIVDDNANNKNKYDVEYNNNINPLRTIINPCFHAGYSETVTSSSSSSSSQSSSSTSSTSSQSYIIEGPELPQANQFELCMNKLKPLLEIKSNSFCNKIYYGDCSIAGAYQPPLPTASNSMYGQFIGTSKFMLPLLFLKMNEMSTLNDWKEKGNMICQWNMDGVHFYYEVNSFSLNENHQEFLENLPNFCFLVSYIVVLLQDGYHFPSDQKIMIIDQYNGNKVGWALGAILYEINELPWEFIYDMNINYSWGFLLVIFLFGKLSYL
jgi:hypothetical protein